MRSPPSPRSLAQIATLLIGLCLSPHALAETMGVSLEYAGPATCPSEDDFWSALTTRTQRVLRVPQGDADVLLRVDLTGASGAILGRLEIVRDGFATEPRYVEAAECADVVQALALTAALGIDPGALTRRPESSAPLQEPLPDSPLSPAPWTRPSDWVSSLGVQIVGAQPVDIRGSWGLAVWMSVHDRAGGAWAPGLRFGAAGLRSDVFDGGAIARFSLLTGFAQVCVLTAHAEQLHVRPCIGTQVGVLEGEAVAVTNPEESRRIWVAAGLAVELEYRLSERLGMQLDLAAHLPFTPQRYSFGLGDVEEIAKTSSIVPWLALGVVYGP